MYDVVGNAMKHKYTHKAAVLDCCFSDSMHIFSGGLDKGVSMYELDDFLIAKILIYKFVTDICSLSIPLVPDIGVLILIGQVRHDFRKTN
jgi:hypothetical protein